MCQPPNVLISPLTFTMRCVRFGVIRYALDYVLDCSTHDGWATKPQKAVAWIVICRAERDGSGKLVNDLVLGGL